HLDLLGGGQCRSDFGWPKRCNECACHSVVDLHAANVEAVAAAPLDEMLAGAVISRCRITTAIMRAQTAAAVPATGEALQEGAAFPHSTTRLVRPGSRVTRDALLVSLISLPVEEAFMMLFDQHLPMIARQKSDPLASNARGVERYLRSGLAIDV